MSSPPVSVVMPVHNAEPFLSECVESILGQTFEDFELVILENGSSDGSMSTLQRYAAGDPRIRLLEHPEPLGIAGSSNLVVSHSAAPLVARMDADDVCRSDRLERQLEVMRAAPDVVVVGTLADGIDSEGRKIRPRDRWRLIRCPEVPFAHGSAMIRRQAFDRVGGYREVTPLAQDVELFLRLAGCGRIVVLPEALYSYRYHLDTTTATCPPSDAARSKEMLHRALIERRPGREHDDVARRAATKAPAPDSVAVGLYYQGANRLWAGEPPEILGDVLGGGSFRFTRAWLTTLVWALWGRVSPRTLRFFLRGWVRGRDLVAGTRVRDGRAYEWRLT